MLREFRSGALRRSRAQVAVAVAVTGVANFNGGTVAKPVGTVWFGWATSAGLSARGAVLTVIALPFVCLLCSRRLKRLLALCTCGLRRWRREEDNSAG